ncbi:MAG: outer membrane protein assembly factor BamD [Planctomycetota bacterium]|nr:MAG: outer membrane protein assembly factor BamD [Planctomycetota bacterium]
MRLLPICATLLAAAISAGAMAQQDFKLDDSDRWKELDAPAPGTPAAVVRLAKLALAKGEPKRALVLMDAWLERFPTDSLRPEALLTRADAKMALKEEYDALFDLEEIARRYAYTASFIPALERELDISKMYAGGLKRKFWGTFRWVNTDDDAQEILIRIQERLPGSALAEKAGMELADFYYDRRDMSLAADAYDLYVQNYPRSRLVDKARLRLIAAYCSGYKGPQFDAKGLQEASAKLRELQATEPQMAKQIGAEAILLRIYESEAEKRLTTANWYWQIGDPISAEREIRALVKKYPRSVSTIQALRAIKDVLAQLPESVRKSAPDYAAIRAELIKDSRAAATIGPAAEDIIEEKIKIDEKFSTQSGTVEMPEKKPETPAKDAVPPAPAAAPAPAPVEPAPAATPAPAPSPAPAAPSI